MNVFDIIIFIIIGIFAVIGFRNGLVKELGSLVALVTGIFITIRFSYFVESILRDEGFFSSDYLPLISYAITFIATVIGVILISKLLDQFVKLVKLQWLNKIAGICFGVIKIVIILGGLFFIFLKFNDKLNLLSKAELDKSIIFKPILSIFEYIFPYVEKLTG